MHTCMHMHTYTHTSHFHSSAYSLSRSYSQVFYDANQAIMLRVSKEGCKNGCAANVNIAGIVLAPMLEVASVRLSLSLSLSLSLVVA